jgi:predicted Zn-dependent protease
MAQCLREMGRYEEAQAIATEFCERLPTNPWGFAELAHIAAARGDLEGAVQCWATARGRHPLFGVAYTVGAEAVRRAGAAARRDYTTGDISGVSTTFVADESKANARTGLTLLSGDVPASVEILLAALPALSR